MPETFYTLEEAAAKLHITPQQLRQMAQRGEVRAFMDRGTWRFRASEIEELARRLGSPSSSELEASGPKTPKPVSGMAGDGPRTPKPGQSPQPATPKSSQSRSTMVASPDVFPFEISPEPAGAGQVDLASLFAQGPKSPGSDSDVRLVPEGSEINLEVLPLEGDKPSKPSSGKQKPESQVRLEPAAPATGIQAPRLSRLDLESDSDVRLVEGEGIPEVRQQAASGHRDSQVRLEPDRRSDAKPDSAVQAAGKSPEGSESTLQLEIDLDSELQRVEESKRALSDSSEERIAAEALQDEERSEFEGQGSEFELRLEEPTSESPPEPSSAETFRLKEDSEELVAGPAADSSSNQPLALDSGEMGSSSGDELSFELSLEDEPTEVTPRPESAKRTPDSSSEFELAVQDEAFDSDMDTQLLTDSPKKGGGSAKSVQESDTELEETSDYDLELVEEGVGEGTPGHLESERPTDVIIDEEAAPDEQTVLVEGSGEVEEVSDLGLDALSAFEEPGSSQLEVAEEEVELAEEAAPAIRYVEVAPADWGLWALLHVPTTLVLIFLGLLLFEVVRSTMYYHEPSLMGGQIYDMLASLFQKK